MTNIEFGIFTIPQIKGNNTFKGSFSIEKDSVHIWIEYDSSEERFSALFDLVEQNEPFSVIIDYKHSSVIGCYECLFLHSNLTTNVEYDKKGHPISSRKPEYEHGYLKAISHCWTDNISADDLDVHCFKSYYLEYRFSDAWFVSSVKDNDITLKDGTLISFICGIDTLTNRRPYRYEERQSGRIFVKRENPFSLREVMDISLCIQVFLRFVTNIQIPPGIIQLNDDKSQVIRYGFHSRDWVKGISEEVFNSLSFPISLQKVLSTEGLLQNWFDSWKKHKNALSRFSECQNPMKSEDCIVALTKTFDALTEKLFSAKKGKKRSINCWLDEMGSFGEEKAKEKSLDIGKTRIKELLGKVKEDSLIMRLQTFSNQNSNPSYQSLIKNTSDGERILSFACKLRNTDSHFGKDVIKSIPEGYQLREIARFMYLLDRDVISRYILKI